MDTDKRASPNGRTTTDVKLPANPDAERAALACALIDEDALPTLANVLSPDDFWSEKYRLIYQAMLDLREAGRPADTITLWDYLNRQGRLEAVGGVSELTAIGNTVPTSAHVEDYAQIVARTADRRRIARLWQDHALAGYSDLGDPLDALAAIQRGITDISERIQRRRGDGMPPVISVANLVAMDIPDPVWTADGLLASGATMLAGAPKVGKSWMALNLALSVAAGGPALGYTCTNRGDVLYLALEDTWHRLKERVLQNLCGEPVPGGLDLAREWNTLDTGGAERIDQWAASKANPRLVIVDTLAKIRGDISEKGSIYQQDYAAISKLKHVADRHGMTVLVLHHLRKMPGEDPFDEISGSQGLFGALDDALILKRAESEYVLHGRGRNIEDTSLAMRFDKMTGLWTSTGKTETVTLTRAAQEVVDVLRAADEPMSPNAIASALGKSRTAVQNILTRVLIKQTVVTCNPGGKYQLSDRRVTFSHTGNYPDSE